MDKSSYETQKHKKDSQVGQGFNNARGEVEDKKDTPKHNGLNVDNDPKHQPERERNKNDR